MEKRQSEEGKKESIIRLCFLSFIFLLLICNIFISVSSAQVSVTEKAVSDEYGEPMVKISEDVITAGDGFDVYVEPTLSAGSWIPVTVVAGHPSFPGQLVMNVEVITFLNDFTDAQGRWRLKDPGGKVFEENMKIEVYKVAWSWKYVIIADDPEWHVPFLAQKGSWRLEFYIWDTALLFIERNIQMLEIHFIVGDSSFGQQLTAPFYFHWGGMAPFGMGAFGFQIPCFLLLLMTPIWIIIIFLIYKIWFAWGRLGKRELRKIIPKKGGKKEDVEKNKAKIV